MKKAILINYTGRKGGGPLDAIEMTKALVENGERVVAVISDQIENINEWFKIPLAKLVTIKTYSNKVSLIKNTLLFSLNQKKHILTELKEFDIEYIYCPMATLWTGLINSLFPHAKTIVAIHDPKPHSGSSILGVKHFEKTYRNADLRVVHSNVFTDYVCEKYGKAIYVPLGEHDIYKSVAEKGRIVDYPSDKINFLFFGRIEPYKGLNVLLKAFLKLNKDEISRTTLTIAGNGDLTEYKEDLNKVTNAQVINRWIKDSEVDGIFTGDNLVLVCPYTDATQSGPIIVAYGYGVPVIATRTGGLIEQVEEDVTGMLVDPGSVDSLLCALKKIVAEPELLNKYQLGTDQLRF